LEHRQFLDSIKEGKKEKEKRKKNKPIMVPNVIEKAQFVFSLLPLFLKVINFCWKTLISQTVNPKKNKILLASFFKRDFPKS
jgi:hypothetical protein